KAAEEGYFVFKIKTGSPGDQEKMLQQDKARLKEIHDILNEERNKRINRIYYTMDANGRYEKKETLRKYLDYAKEIGAFEHILLYEEPIARFTAPKLLIVHWAVHIIYVDHLPRKLITVPKNTLSISRVPVQFWVKLIFFSGMKRTLVNWTPLQGPIAINQRFGWDHIGLAFSGPVMRA